MLKLFVIFYRVLLRPWKTRPYLWGAALSSQTKQKAPKEAEVAGSDYPETRQVPAASRAQISGCPWVVDAVSDPLRYRLINSSRRGSSHVCLIEQNSSSYPRQWPSFTSGKKMKKQWQNWCMWRAPDPCKSKEYLEKRELLYLKILGNNNMKEKKPNKQTLKIQFSLSVACHGTMPAVSCGYHTVFHKLAQGVKSATADAMSLKPFLFPECTKISI